MIVRNRIVNSLWQSTARKDYTNFVLNMNRARTVQENYLFDLIQRNKNSRFGHEHGFGSIRSIADYRNSVPVRSYDNFKSWIDLVVKGENKVLTDEDVLLLEPTGGSSGGLKLIPYTKSLGDEFLRGINAWIYDLFKTYPDMKRGLSYWSISPPVEKFNSIDSKVPVGFDDDTNYLGWAGNFVSRVMVGNSGLKNITDMDEFRFQTSLELLKAAELSFISIWNPTFLTIMIGYMEENIDRLIGELAVHDKNRAWDVERAFNSNKHERFEKIWPMLKVISCWADGSAKIYAENLGSIFPDVKIQAKGLLATEGFITFPLTMSGGQALSYMSHYFEFADENNDIFSCDELFDGGKYRVIISTGGGLYRYDLGDHVIVDRLLNGLPVLTFTGRDSTVDMFGEKLTEAHVGNVLAEALRIAENNYSFAMLAPEPEPDGGAYILYIEADRGLNGEISKIHSLVEDGLKQNYYYRQAVDVGQLKNLKLFRINSGGIEKYIERCVSEGQKTGDIKPATLDKRSGWSEWFDGNFVD